MSGSIPTVEQLQFFLTQLASAQSALATAQTAFSTAQKARDQAQGQLDSVIASARAQFQGMLAGSSQPTAQDLLNSLAAIGNAQSTLATAQTNFVAAQKALIPAQQALDVLVANARQEFSQVFGA